MTNRAIVVGIQGYPELPPPLQGPENDAKDFYAWVTDPKGGGVNGDPTAGEAVLILSSKYPPANAALGAQPTSTALVNEFDRLEVIARDSLDGHAGKRLYLYLSGHGFGQDLANAALLMANATQSTTRHHVPGRAWADHFYVSGYFDEVLLFMDCCRERYATAILNGPGSPPAQTPPPNGRRFYALSAKHGGLSVEKDFNGQSGGVFTRTLLDALKGGAAEENGDITGESLLAYLYENMRGYLTPADLANANVAREPDLFCDPQALAKTFVIARATQVLHPIQIQLPPNSQEKALELLDGEFAVVAQGTGDTSGVWQPPPVPRGTYLLIVNENRRVVRVNGMGVVDVN